MKHKIKRIKKNKMEKETNIIILLVVAGLIISAVSVGVGIFYQSKKDNSEIQKTPVDVNNLLKSLSSNIINAVSAYGGVTNIEGRDITLSYGGSSLTINVAENTAITEFAPTVPGSNQGIPKNLKFSDIKKGDNVNIALKIMPDGSLSAQTVLVFANTIDTTVPALPKK